MTRSSLLNKVGYKDEDVAVRGLTRLLFAAHEIVKRIEEGHGHVEAVFYDGERRIIPCDSFIWLN